jgi:tetratricopeptide (TPR) repeat protein
MDSAEPEVSATQDAGTSAPDPGAAEFELGDDAMLLNQILVEAASGTPAAERLFAMEQYLARYPGSDNADLVLAERVEALADIGADREVLAAAETFIQQYPDSSRRSQVRWVEATVARDRLRDCSRALRAYRELAEAGGTHHVEAMYYRGVCAAEEGYPQEASQSLERAIELGLDPTREREARALLDSLR